MHVTMSDLFLAYRQAKTSLYFEKRGVGLVELAAYENNLAYNLTELQGHLHDSGGWFNGIDPGQVWIVPKRRRLSHNDSDQVTFIGATTTANDSEGLDIQIRLSPTPNFAIIEILYLWRFGPALDSMLPEEAIGYRLDLRGGEIRKHARWVFEYWPERYNQFRREPLDIAKNALDTDLEHLDILSADLASFYDTVNARFLLQPEIIDNVGLPALVWVNLGASPPAPRPPAPPGRAWVDGGSGNLGACETLNFTRRSWASSGPGG